MWNMFNSLLWYLYNGEEPFKEMKHFGAWVLKIVFFFPLIYEWEYLNYPASEGNYRCVSFSAFFKTLLIDFIFV